MFAGSIGLLAGARANGKTQNEPLLVIQENEKERKEDPMHAAPCLLRTQRQKYGLLGRKGAANVRTVRHNLAPAHIFESQKVELR